MLETFFSGSNLVCKLLPYTEAACFMTFFLKQIWTDRFRINGYDLLSFHHDAEYDAE